MILKPLILFCAWILDAFLGDPEAQPHPVRLIGAYISRLQTWSIKTFKNKKIAGVFIGVFVPCTVYLCAFIIVEIFTSIRIVFGTIVSIVILYTCISTKCLGAEAKAVMKKLEAGDMIGARHRLSRIVGRDTAALSQEEIIRATVESVSENTVDGIISPLFYASIGGAPLAMAYKAINTLDSMIGYKNETFIDLGWFSARLDDAANYIPARISVIVIACAAVCVKPARWLTALKTGFREGHKSPSPNSGYSEACFAGALGIQLGGECTYKGIRSQKPLLGEKEHELVLQDITQSIRLMWLTSAAMLMLCVAVCSI